jgi:hypothetical protein
VVTSSLSSEIRWHQVVSGREQLAAHRDADIDRSPRRLKLRKVMSVQYTREISPCDVSLPGGVRTIVRGPQPSMTILKRLAREILSS